MRAHFTYLVKRDKRLSPPEDQIPPDLQTAPCERRSRLTPDQRLARLAELRARLAGTAPLFEAQKAQIQDGGGQP